MTGFFVLPETPSFVINKTVMSSLLYSFACSLLFLIIPAFGFGSTPPDTVWNQTDGAGKKQGYWRKYYPNGELIYRGCFQDDRPVGLMQRFYEDGGLKAELVFSGISGTARATLYYRNGMPGARGKYTGQLRDSVWSFYSYHTGSLSCLESYNMGKKEGPTIKFYPEGNKAEVLFWKNDRRHGKWEQYYEDSTLRLSSQYKSGEIDGPYRVYNRNRVLLIDGVYRDGKMDGDWMYYDQEGNLQHILKYDNGTILNEEEFEKWKKQFMEDLEKDMGTIPEPDFENFFDKSP